MRKCAKKRERGSLNALGLLLLTIIMCNTSSEKKNYTPLALSLALRAQEKNLYRHFSVCDDVRRSLMRKEKKSEEKKKKQRKRERFQLFFPFLLHGAIPLLFQPCTFELSRVSIHLPRVVLIRFLNLLSEIIIFFFRCFVSHSSPFASKIIIFSFPFCRGCAERKERPPERVLISFFFVASRETQTTKGQCGERSLFNHSPLQPDTQC